MKKNFNEVFNSLKRKYEDKERNTKEIQTYELLKKMIKIYGYNSVCDKISLSKQNNKNNELGIFIDDIKNNMPLELLCSQMFYLDDSITFQNEKLFTELNTNLNLNKNKNKASIYKIAYNLKTQSYSELVYNSVNKYIKTLKEKSQSSLNIIKIKDINKNKTKKNKIIFKFYKKETNDNSIKLKNEIN